MASSGRAERPSATYEVSLLRQVAEDTRALIDSLPPMDGMDTLNEALRVLDDFIAPPRGRGRRLAVASFISDAAALEAVAILNALSAEEPHSMLFIDTADSLMLWMSNEMERVRGRLPEDASQALWDDVSDIDRRLSISRTFGRVKRAESDFREGRAEVAVVAQEAAESVETARELIGDAAASELGAEFAEYAAKESSRAFLWSAGAITALLLVSFVSSLLIIEVNVNTVAEELARLAATLPLVAVALYAARIAAHHRATAHWARSYAVQLKTIRAYSDALSDHRRDELRLEFGLRVFAPAVPGAAKEAATPSLVDTTALVEKASEALKGAAEAVRAIRP